MNPLYGYIYIAQRSDQSIKIGTSQTPERRIRQIETASGVAFIDSMIFYSYNPYGCERHLHKRYGAFRETGEYFYGGDCQVDLYTVATEYLSSRAELVELEISK